MVRTGEVVGAMAATDWARVSQGVRMLWRRPYSVWLEGASDGSTAEISGGSGASPEKLVQSKLSLRATMKGRPEERCP
jgi:hypothetical protein